MLTKLTAKNQLTLPKSVTQAVDATEYFDVEARAGQIILTPVRIQRGDAMRAKLAELNLGQADIADAVSWVRATAVSPAVAAEPEAAYSGVGKAKARAKATGGAALAKKATVKNPPSRP